MDRPARRVLMLFAVLLLVLVVPSSIRSAPARSAGVTEIVPVSCGPEIYNPDTRGAAGLATFSATLAPSPACDWGVQPPYEGPTYETEDAAAAADPPPPTPVPVTLPTWRNLYDWPNAHGYVGWRSASSRVGAYRLEQNLGGNAGLWIWPAGDQDYTASDSAEWTYTAPGTTRIAKVNLSFAYRNKLLAHHCLVVGLRTEAGVIAQNEWCQPAKPPDSQRDVPVTLVDPSSNPSSTTLFFRIRVDCKGSTTCSKNIPSLDPLQTAGTARLKLVNMTLVDDDLPIATASGELHDLRSSYIRGTATYGITVSGDDAGSGIDRIWLDRDGARVFTTSAQCDLTHQTAALGTRLCPAMVSTSNTVDSTVFPEGVATFAVGAEDVAHNVGLGEPWEIFVDRTPPGAVSGIELYYFDAADAVAGIRWTAAVDPPLPGGILGSGAGVEEYRYRRGAVWTPWQTTDEGGFVVSQSTAGDIIEVEVRGFDTVGNSGPVASGIATVTAKMYESISDSGTSPDVVYYDEANPGNEGDTGETGSFAISSGFRYDPFKAVSYAIRWVGDTSDVLSPAGYNPTYHRFNKFVNGKWDGNDCQNFVSQALTAASWTRDLGFFFDESAWWYNGGGRLAHTESWSLVNNFNRYLQQGDRATLAYEGPNTASGGVRNAQLGDIILVRWDRVKAGTIRPEHSMIVTQRRFVQGRLLLGVTYHTSNRLHKSMGRLMTENKDAYWYVWRSRRD